MSVLAQTSMTLFIDGPTMTNALAELLRILEVQEGRLPQGSMKTGSEAPSGSILFSSNYKESKRYMLETVIS